MPRWIHDRAEHLLSKNPSMAKSQAFAIATQQSHALGKTPEGYGTDKAKEKAKKKYKTPEDDVTTADPAEEKTAQRDLKEISQAAFSDELAKISSAITRSRFWRLMRKQTKPKSV